MHNSPKKKMNWMGRLTERIHEMGVHTNCMTSQWYIDDGLFNSTHKKANKMSTG